MTKPHKYQSEPSILSYSERCGTHTRMKPAHVKRAHMKQAQAKQAHTKYRFMKHTHTQNTRRGSLNLVLHNNYIFSPVIKTNTRRNYK